MVADPVALEEIIIDLVVAGVLEVTPELGELVQVVLVVMVLRGQEAGLVVVELEIHLALRHFLGNGLVV
jgi:hypothetical protein